MIHRTIRPIRPEERDDALTLLQTVFTEYDCAREGLTVRRLAEEIRRKRFYLPELELVAVSDEGALLGYAMFSRFHLEGRYEDRLLMLTPVAVRTDVQRQHISKDLLEYGFAQARRMGCDAVIVEGNPANYRARGFVTSEEHGILRGKTVACPPQCLMVKELRPGALSSIHGTVEYADYDAITHA